VVDGVELLAHIIHPELHAWTGASDAFRQIPSPCLKRGSTRLTQAAFTLIELLVTVAIIAILAALFVPALTRSQATGRRVACMNNLRQLGLAVQMYWDDNAGNCFRYSNGITNGGQLYWFGWMGPGQEGKRPFDATRERARAYRRPTIPSGHAQPRLRTLSRDRETIRRSCGPQSATRTRTRPPPLRTAAVA